MAALSFLLTALTSALLGAAVASAQGLMCGPNQISCDSNRYCCEAETEVCGWPGVCLPKHPFTPSPGSRVGGLVWAVNLTSSYDTTFGPVLVNATHAVASGGSGVSWIRLADGETTLAFATPAQYPLLVAGGQVFVASLTTLMTLNIATGQPGWSTSYPQFGVLVPLFAWGDYLVVFPYFSSRTALTVLNARSGIALYNITVSTTNEWNYGSSLVVTKYGTVAFTTDSQFYIFDLRTGAVLVNATCSGATPLVDDANSVVISPNLVAYDARTGAVQWSAGAGPINPLALADTRVAYLVISFASNFGSNSGDQYLWMAGLSKANGTVLWNVSIHYDGILPNYFDQIQFVPEPSGTQVLLGQGTLVAVDAATGQVNWNCSSFDFSASFIGTGFAFDDRHPIAYTVAQNSTNPLALIAVNTTDGSIADWSYFEVGLWPGWLTVNSPVLWGSYVLFLSQNGFLYCLRALPQLG